MVWLGHQLREKERKENTKLSCHVTLTQITLGIIWGRRAMRVIMDGMPSQISNVLASVRKKCYLKRT